MTISPRSSYQMIKALVHAQVMGWAPVPAPAASWHNATRRYLGPIDSARLLQLHPKICLTGGCNHDGRGRGCSKSPTVQGNPSYCRPDKPCPSDLGGQQAPPAWFLSRYPEANPQSAADPQLVFSLIYVRAYLHPLLKTIQFVSAVNETVYHPAAVWLLPEMSFTPVLIKQRSF